MALALLAQMGPSLGFFEAGQLAGLGQMDYNWEPEATEHIFL